MTAADLDLDLTTLVGEMEAPACEHPNHLGSPAHTDGDEHYVRFHTDCGHIFPLVKVVCGAWLRWLRRKDKTLCSQCGGSWSFAESVTDLGPVADFL